MTTRVEFNTNNPKPSVIDLTDSDFVVHSSFATENGEKDAPFIKITDQEEESQIIFMAPLTYIDGTNIVPEDWGITINKNGRVTIIPDKTVQTDIKKILISRQSV